MLAVATMLALDYPLKIAVAHTDAGETPLERAYAKLRYTDRLQSAAGGGMDAILRLTECDLLTPALLRDHTESILKERLDLIAGAAPGSRQLLAENFPLIKAAAAQYYDILFVDVTATADGTANDLVSRQALMHADLIVKTVNQNEFLLERMRLQPMTWSTGDDSGDEGLLCVGAYESTSKLTLDRIAKQLGTARKRIGAVPRNVRFMDAMNEGRILDYLLRAMAAKKRFLEHDEQADFIAAVRSMGKLVLRALDLAPTGEMSVKEA